MTLEEQSVNILDTDDPIETMKMIELAGRNCYNSYDKVTEDSYDKFIRGLIKRGHDSPLEFASMTVRLNTSRDVMCELTRHRHGSFCITSQRYIDEKDDLTVIKPSWYQDESGEAEKIWHKNMLDAESAYSSLRNLGRTPQEARTVLPNSTKCSIIMKANLREWRHIFKLRCGAGAYPAIRNLMTTLLDKAIEKYPAVFDDLKDE